MSASSRERPHRDQRTRMLEEPVPRLVLTLAVPTIISMMVTSIYYNMADTYFVSQINTSASGAVGIVFFHHGDHPGGGLYHRDGLGERCVPGCWDRAFRAGRR